MEEQRKRSQEASKFGVTWQRGVDDSQTLFQGYEGLEARARLSPC